MLSERPDLALRMSRLAQRLAVPVVERGETPRSPRLVRRKPDPDDGRATRAVLTGHVATVRELVADALDQAQLTELHAT